MATAETRPDAVRDRKVDAFVFDCVCHIFNFDKANALGPPGELFDEHLYAFHQLLTRVGSRSSRARSSSASGASTRSTTWSSRAPTPT